MTTFWKRTLLCLLSSIFHVAFSQSPELMLPIGHTDFVRGFAISPNGNYAASGGDDTFVKIWDIANGKELRSFSGHTKKINSVEFSPRTSLDQKGGKYLLTTSEDKTVKLWEANTGKLLVNFKRHSSYVKAAIFTNDGKHIISAGKDYQIKIWEAKTGKEINSFRTNSARINCIALSKDGKYFLTGSSDKIIQLWNYETGQILKTFKGHTKDVLKVAFSIDDQQVFSASKDKSIKLWDIKTGETVQTFQDKYSIKDLSLSKDGKRFLASSANTMKIWDIDQNKVLSEIKEGKSSFYGGQFTPDEKYLIGMRGNRDLELWEISSGKKIRTFKGATNLLYEGVYSPDGQYFVTAGADRTLKLWDTTTGKLVRNFIDKHSRQINSLVFSSDSKYVLSSSDDKTSKIWEVATGREIQSLTGHKNWVVKAIFSPDGKYVISGSRDKTIKIWDTKTGENIRTFEGHTNKIQNLSISPNGKYILSCDIEKNLKLWELNTGNVIRIFTENKDNIYSIAFSPITIENPEGGKYVATTGFKTFIIWDVETGKIISKSPKQSSRIINLAFSPDEKKLFTVSKTEIKIWNVNSGKEQKSYSPKEEISFGCLSPDQENALIGLKTHKTQLINLNTMKLKSTLVSFSNSTDWIQYTDDRYYYASKNASKQLHYTIGLKPYTFDQFDLQYNRPDIVIGRIGQATSTLKESYKSAYIKRLKKMGFTQNKIQTLLNGNFENDFSAPEVYLDDEVIRILKTQKKNISFDLKAIDPNGKKIEKLFIYVNDVPIYGVQGKSITHNSNDTLFHKVESLELSNGNNKIKVTVLNEDGVSSLAQQFEVDYEGNFKKPDLYVISIGVANYSDKEMNLDYAAKDAQDLTSLLKNKVNYYENIHAFTFLNENATKDNILRIKQNLLKSKVDDEVILFVAGHGLLDEKLDYYIATYNVDFKNPSINGLLYEDLENLLDNIPARKKVMLIDACHSGEVDKEEVEIVSSDNNLSFSEVKFRGFKKLKPKTIGLKNSFQLMQTLFNDLRSSTGVIVISAASGMEFSYESEEWNNGVFTYSILEGLKTENADLNKDGKIKISELKNYVIEKVEKLTQGNQHPTSRKENLTFDFDIW